MSTHLRMSKSRLATLYSAVCERQGALNIFLIPLKDLGYGPMFFGPKA